MKKNLLIISVCLMVQAAHAQNFYFPATNYSDSVMLEKKLPLLAMQVIEKYHEGNLLSYNDNLFRLQLVSGKYENAIKSLQTLIGLVGEQAGDTVTTKVTGFAFQVYLSDRRYTSKLNEVSPKYKEQFMLLYNALNEEAKDKVPLYFAADVPATKNRLNALLNTVKKSDSISIANALTLCRTYGAIKVLGKTQLLANTILARLEHDRYISNDSVLVKMPDGGTVSLTFYRDRQVTTPQPVVLLYNIYAGSEATDCKLAVQHGYVGVVANTRGKRLSPDALEPFEHDAKDAYEIIDWISKQPWCNGKVGMYGGSYLGFAQWSATKYLHPALKTIVPQAAAAPGIDFPIMNGIFPLYVLRYLHYVMDNKLTDDAGFFNYKKWDDMAGNWYKKGASFRLLDTLEGRPSLIYQRMLDHPSYDSFWQNMIPQKEAFAQIKIPILITTGYYDDDQLGAMYYYQQYHQWNKNPNDYLLIGPFDHGGAQYKPSSILGGYPIDSVAKISIINIVFDWFNYVLKDGNLPSILKDHVNFEVMGTNQWRHVTKLNQLHNDSLTFYLGNKLNGNAYALVPAITHKTGFIEQQVDMTERNDLRFREEDIIAFTKLTDSTLLPEKEKLVFVSEPVDGTFAISGAMKATIDLSINKKDIDLVIDLYEQTPDGHYFALNESLQRASYAKDRTLRQLLRPGKMQTIRLEHNFIISKKLAKGSRIIITLGVNKSPNWQVNYGTGKDVSDETIADGKIPLKIKWYSSSHINLPILR